MHNITILWSCSISDSSLHEEAGVPARFRRRNHPPQRRHRQARLSRHPPDPPRRLQVCSRLGKLETVTRSRGVEVKWDCNFTGHEYKVLSPTSGPHARYARWRCHTGRQEVKLPASTCDLPLDISEMLTHSQMHCLSFPKSKHSFIFLIRRIENMNCA